MTNWASKYIGSSRPSLKKDELGFAILQVMMVAIIIAIIILIFSSLRLSEVKQANAAKWMVARDMLEKQIKTNLSDAATIRNSEVMGTGGAEYNETLLKCLFSAGPVEPNCTDVNNIGGAIDAVRVTHFALFPQAPYQDQATADTVAPTPMPTPNIQPLGSSLDGTNSMVNLKVFYNAYGQVCPGVAAANVVCPFQVQTYFTACCRADCSAGADCAQANFFKFYYKVQFKLSGQQGLPSIMDRTNIGDSSNVISIPLTSI